MNTNQLKRFATEARANLMAGVKRRVHALGFDADGHVKAGMEPELVQGATLWNKQELPESFYGQWNKLRELLHDHGIKEVVEEAAYTWFNRLMAIRILTMNRLCDEILTFDASAGMPRLLANARLGIVPDMDAQQERHFRKLMEDDNLVSDQFAAVLSAWCHNNPIISACFGSISDYVELLLPANIAQEGGFLSLMNDTPFITKEDYRSAELIGWLYQFYISDRKDEVFAKKGKVEADEIPAATQIFTPNWIVKYMVENTVIPQVDAPQEIIDNAKYLVKEAAECDRKVELEDLKVADLACGSGHILNECFNLLFDLYRKEAYSRHEAIEEIFTKNLMGIDLDLRAKQLATFSLLLKACIMGRDEDDPDTYFADAHCLPHVLTVPELSNEMLSGDEQMIAGYLHHFFLGSETSDARDELVEAIKLVKYAPSLGSIIKFNLSSSTRRQLEETVEHWKSQSHLPEAIKEGLPVMDFILALTDSYDAIVMNPPYMGSGRFDDVLSKYVAGGGKGKEKTEANYPDSKADLFAIFMDVAYDRLKDGGRYGMINMQSWMFLSSFEKLRTRILKEQTISSMLHLGPRTFDELSGEVVQNTAFVIEKTKPTEETTGTYFRLVDGKNCGAKEVMIRDGLISRTKGIVYSFVSQFEYAKIPASAIGYWLNTSSVNLFGSESLSHYLFAGHGILTGHDEGMIRYWRDINFKLLDLNCCSRKDLETQSKIYVPLSKGGTYRKWYGNNELVLKYDDKTIQEMSRYPKFTLQNSERYFTEGLSWSFELVHGDLSVRYLPKGFIFHHRGPVIQSKHKGISDLMCLGFLCSKVPGYFLRILNPTISCSAGVVNKIPIKDKDKWPSSLVNDCISISRRDWDAHETSWDFKENELVRIFKDNGWGPLQTVIEEYKNEWSRLFNQLHANEEELNRQFIDIYGLKDELSPEVPLNEVTILQQGEVKVTDQYTLTTEDDTILTDEKGRQLTVTGDTYLDWQDDVIIKQLISYMVGVWMGRYRLDRPGLNIAHPNPTEEEMADNEVNGHSLTIDSDAIIPILPKDAPFPDNLVNYVEKFVRTVFDEEDANENLNFIETCLGKSIEAYLDKDFWKDHKKMYQNRPIYWLFSSKKGAFKAVVYVHRMDKYTVEQVRAKYLLPYIGYTERQIKSLEKREGSISTAERKELDRRRAELIDMREYHDRLQQRAAEVAAWPDFIDLDDGIIANYAKFGDILTKIK